MSNLTRLPRGEMEPLDTTAVEELPVGVDLAGPASKPRSLALHHPYEPSRLGRPWSRWRYPLPPPSLC